MNTGITDILMRCRITVAETDGDVQLRGGYYDEAGALRDMVPNHLFQLGDADGDGAAEFV